MRMDVVQLELAPSDPSVMLNDEEPPVPERKGIPQSLVRDGAEARVTLAGNVTSNASERTPGLAELLIVTLNMDSLPAPIEFGLTVALAVIDCE